MPPSGGDGEQAEGGLRSAEEGGVFEKKASCKAKLPKTTGHYTHGSPHSCKLWLFRKVSACVWDGLEAAKGRRTLHRSGQGRELQGFALRVG